MEISSAPRSSNDRPWDWRAVFLAIAIVEISSTRLVETEWVPFLYLTQSMGFFGLILGLALGTSNFSRQTVIRLSTGYTLVLLPAQLLNVTQRTDWLWQDVVSLLERLFISLIQFFKNQPVDDYIFFISIVTFIYWIIGLSAGYWLIRHRNFLNVVLPSGFAMLTVHAFDSNTSKHVWEIAVFIFISLLLLGRMRFLQNKAVWEKTHFLLTDEAINDLERGALAVAAIVVFVAWSLPGWVSGIGLAAQAWQDVSQPIFDRLSNAVSALDSPYAGNNSGGDFYGAGLALGQYAATSDTPIFTVYIKGNKFVPVRNYWKGRVYDLYLNGHWSTVSNSSDPFDPESDELIIEYPEARQKINFVFVSSIKKQKLLYTPAETIWVSTKANVNSTPISVEVKDVTAWVATKSLSNGNQYRVRALTADPTIEELRSTSSEYPAWVTDRYLQVPEDIAPQLRELTLQVTEPYDNVYDKVQAVTSYLRNEIKYDTKIVETIPKDQDPLLWVLFDHKKGFCMYYASAETLMLRSIGIPARMAVGFVEGEYDELKGRYVVTYKDSHAWPEVYFPGIGWVEFEPTSNQSPIERPETKNVDNDGNQTDPNAAENLAANPLENLPEQERPESLLEENGKFPETDPTQALYRNILIVTLTLLALGCGIFIIRRYSPNERLPVYLVNQYKQRGEIPPRWLDRWARWINLSSIERAFQAINLSLFWLGHPQPAHTTSQERAEILIKHLPSAQAETLSLLQEYQSATYTPRAGDVSAARKAASVILFKTLKFRIKETLKIPDTRYNQSK